MATRREEPHMIAVSKDGDGWLLRADNWDAFNTAWMAGKSFWAGVDLWEQPVVIKLGDIVGVISKTAESLALLTAEAEELKARAVIEGDDD